MMRFSEPLQVIGDFERNKELWRWLLECPTHFYDLQMLLVDDCGSLYYTTDPLIFVDFSDPEQRRVTFCTRTTATCAMRITAYKFIVKDVKKWLPPKYETIVGGGEDGEDLKVWLPQYYDLTSNRFPNPVVMLPGDNFRPSATLIIPPLGMLEPA
jgi:hypothetical protein